MTKPYASETKVPISRTRQQIEDEMVRFGADQFAAGWDRLRGVVRISFACQGRKIRLSVPLPMDDQTIKSGAETRRKWRAYYMVIKAKLVAIQEGITSVEEQFHAEIVMENGQTLYEWSQPQIQQMYETGRMPELLPRLESGPSRLEARQIEGRTKP